MAFDKEKIRRIFREMHYQEGVDSLEGFIQEREIHEVTAEKAGGGFATYQQIKRFQLGCGHIDYFENHCSCNRTCCKHCLCSVCQKGVCSSCGIRTEKGPLICLPCKRILDEMELQEQERTTWLTIMTAFGLIKE